MAYSIYEIITAYTAGLLILYLLTFFLRLKRQHVLRLACKSLIGTALYVAASLLWGFTGSVCAEIFLCGLSGLIGCAVLAAVYIF